MNSPRRGPDEDGGRKDALTRETTAHGRATGARTRRRLLAACGASAAALLAGCLGGITHAGKRPFAENPVAANVEQRPRLGPPRDESSITLVAFDDPSCPSCAHFHENAFQRIRSEWIQSGEATLFTRARPYVAEWARPAQNALIEVHRRADGSEPYWALNRAYYAHQDELTADNIHDRTERFLEGIGTSSSGSGAASSSGSGDASSRGSGDASSSPSGGGAIDAAAVVAAAENRRHEPLIDASVTAAKRAGARGVPQVFVFREGEFVTVLGDDDFSAYRSAVRSHA